MLSWIRRVHAFLRRGRLDQQLADEMREHMALRRQALIDDGMDPREAEYAAKRLFGNQNSIAERTRDARGFTLLASLLQDLRYGARLMTRTPGHSAAIVLTIALGAGLNGAVFVMFNAVVLRPPVVADAKHVVRLDDGKALIGPTYPDYVDYRDRVSATVDLAAFTRMTVRAAYRSAERDEPHVERVSVGLVSGNFFDVMLVRPTHGRAFGGRDDLPPSGTPVAMLGDAYWARRFNRDPSVIGRTIELNFQPFTIVGIVPGTFLGVDGPNGRPRVKELWVPLWSLPLLHPGNRMLVDRTMWAGLETIGRLKPGRTIAQAQAEIAAVAAALDGEYQGRRGRRVPAVRGIDDFDARILLNENGVIAAAMATATLLILLIACANVSSLLLARASARSREIAIRLALGAGRARIVRQFLTESFILSAMGTMLGLIAAQWALQWMMGGADDQPLTISLTPDARVATYAIALASLVACVTGIVPALQASKPSLLPALRDVAGSYRLSRTRAVFVGAEVAMSLLLLVVTGLLLRGAQRAHGIDPILPVDALLSVDVGESQLHGYSGGRQAALVAEVERRIEALPGVTATALASPMPFSGNRSATILRRADRADGPPVRVFLSGVTPSFFQVANLQLISGRGLARDAADEIVVNQVLASMLWGESDPIGQRVTSGEYDRRQHIVVGIVRDAPYLSLRQRSEPFLFRPIDRSEGRTVLARTSGRAATLAHAAEEAVRGVDRRLEPDARPLVDGIDDEIDAARNGGNVAGGLGALALVLALFGVAAVTANAVVQRTHEIGVRMALGARTGDATRLIIRQTLRPVGAGVVLGLLGAGAVSRVLAVQLYGLSPIDPIAFGAAALFFVTASTVAAWIPARRAARVDPLIALRAE